MRRNNLLQHMGGKAHTGDIREDWMVAVEGIVVVNDDPEGQHRIKVVIPLIDESVMYDDWVAALMPWVGPDGYGPMHQPALGSEVVLFGRLGEKQNLFYISRFNEDFKTPTGFDGARGLKTDTAFKLLADLFIQIISLQTLLLQATTQADVKSAVVRLMGNETEGVRVEPGKLSFLGASAIERQTLPGPADNLASCIILTNAIRSALIAFGLCR